MTKLGFVGAHRSGKTTLASAIAEMMRVPFIETNTSAVFKQQNLDPSQCLDFSTRLHIQKQILKSALHQWQQSESAFVTDRTPIDFMAYTLADIQGATQVESTALTDYLTDCFAVANYFFDVFIIVQPAIPLVHATGKAALNKAYMAHLNSLMIGLTHDEQLQRPVFILKRQLVELEERIQWVSQLLQKNELFTD